jgi:hypothetical protein
MQHALPNWGVVPPDLVCKQLKKYVDNLPLEPPSSVDKQVQQLTTGLATIQDSFGRTVTDNSNQAKSWWCKTTLDPIIQNRKRARQWFILTKSPKSLECYRQWSQYFRKMVRSLKRNAWLRFLEDSAANPIWKALQTTKSTLVRTTPPLRRPDGSLTSDSVEQAELLFIGNSCIDAPVDLANIHDGGPSRFVCFLQVTTQELANCIGKILPKKALGIEGIANEMLKMSSP